MMAPNKGITVLLVAVSWAIAGNYNYQHTTAPLSACSAWTIEPGFRHHRRLYDISPKRRRPESSLFSATPTTASQASSAETSNDTTATYRDLFPASNKVTNGTLQVGSIHTLYYEIHGTGPLSALFLHGGPGAGCFPNHARFFDPSKYTVVLLDQRGAGKSTPKGCVQENTLEYLVEDCERLRWHLQSILPNNSSHDNKNNENTNAARPWDVVLGGSWGATLGLAYAQKHPSALRSLILRGICALRPSEVDWLFSAQGGSALQLQEAWKNFSDAVGTTTSSELSGRDTLHAYYDCLFNSGANGTANNAIRLAAARYWMMWEMSATSSAAAQSSNNNTNQSSNPPSSGTVLVSSPEHDGGKWRFENHLGEPATDDTNTGRSAEFMASQLRKDIENPAQSELAMATEPRPVRPVGESIPLLKSMQEASQKSNGNKTRFQLPPDYVPAQAMLTCYYSVNDRFVMGNNNLLETGSDSNNSTPVKIIGVQGGRDPICPPDTALDLLRALQMSTNNMELRIPLESGHSMYDPAIKHELVKATDRLADELLSQ